jgi:hypothetical protein
MIEPVRPSTAARRALRGARDQQHIAAGEPSPDLERGAYPVLGQGVAVTVGIAAQFDVWYGDEYWISGGRVQDYNGDGQYGDWEGQRR